MENQSIKLKAPKAIFKSNPNFRSNKLMTPVKAFSDCPFNNFELVNKQKSYTDPSFKTQLVIKSNLDWNEIERDFEEFSIKSEILGILNNSKCKLNNSGGSCFTRENSQEVSEVTIKDEKQILPPNRTKNPLCNEVSELNSEEKIDFSKFLKKKVK